MPIKYSQAVLAVLALVAAPAFAQESATPTEAPAATAPAAEAPAAEAPAAEAPATATPAAETPADQAPANEAAPAAPADAATAPGTLAAEGTEPRVGQYYIKSTNTDWNTRCLKAQQGKDPCELYQLLKDSSNNPVAEFTLIPLQNGEVAAGATLVAPLETDLIQGLGFAVGAGEARGYPFSFCAPAGCVSRMGFTQAELDALKRGNEATVTLLPFGGDKDQPVQLKVSLAGFTAAIDELSAYANEPAPAPAPVESPAAPAQAPAN